MCLPHIYSVDIIFNLFFKSPHDQTKHVSIFIVFGHILFYNNSFHVALDPYCFQQIYLDAFFPSLAGRKRITAIKHYVILHNRYL